MYLFGCAGPLLLGGDFPSCSARVSLIVVAFLLQSMAPVAAVPGL